MKCPFRKKVIYNYKRTVGSGLIDNTQEEFLDCLKKECHAYGTQYAIQNDGDSESIQIKCNLIDK